ncbi:hypothetical protein OH77DRAFT_1439408 [Trametes cingulata]|nr:hypothetical protein OH77DRAFT_1439408 [Trametes cingulata]
MPNKRYQPTLLTHPEVGDADDENDEWHCLPLAPTRLKSRQRNAFSPNASSANAPTISSTMAPPPPLRSAYTNIYNQFVRRYRNGHTIDDDPRNDPESHYYQCGFGQLLDGADSDDEDTRVISGMGGEPHDRISALMLNAEPIEPQTFEDRERLKWQTMLASVLAGDVLKAENTRIAVTLNSSSEEENNPRAGIWLGIRARFHGGTVEEERKKLGERRLRTVDSVIKEIMNSRVQDPPHGSSENRETYALQQVNAVLRVRSRKLQRLARVLSHRFSDSAEYDLEPVDINLFISTLVESDHFLVYTQSFEEEGTYIVAPPGLREHPDVIRRLLVDAFHVNEIDESSWLMESGELDPEDEENASYLLVLSPRTRFLRNGLVLMFQIPKIDLHLEDNHVRLIADGLQHRLALAKRQFAELFEPIEDEETGEPIEPTMPPLPCLVEQQAHLPLAESIVEAVHVVRHALKDTNNYQELLENWYGFASDHATHVQKCMDRQTLMKYNESLNKLAISWVSFICDDCDPNNRKTFRWAVTALEFTLHRTRRNNILHLLDDQSEMLRQKVASCMTLLISHFDILGACSTLEAKREKERQEELLRQHARGGGRVPGGAEDQDSVFAYADPALRAFWEKASQTARDIEEHRAQIGAERHIIGRVLVEKILVDRSVVFLAGSSSNISIWWQQRRFIGAGSFGSVYLAINLDSRVPARAAVLDRRLEHTLQDIRPTRTYPKPSRTRAMALAGRHSI